MNRDSVRLSVVCWNVRSLKARLHDLLDLVNNISPDVLCLSETKLNTNDYVSIPNFVASFQSRNSRGGGTGIMIRSELSFSFAKHTVFAGYCSKNNVDVSFCRVDLARHKTLTIISVYSPPRHRGTFTDPDF